MNPLIAPTYQENKVRMNQLAEQLKQHPCTLNEDTLSGDWELIYSDVELFRSRHEHPGRPAARRPPLPPLTARPPRSPFFLAIEDALDSSPGIPLLGQWLGT